MYLRKMHKRGLYNTITVIELDENIDVSGIIKNGNTVDTSKVQFNITSESTKAQSNAFQKSKIYSVSFGKYADGSYNYHQIIVNWGHTARD